MDSKTFMTRLAKELDCDSSVATKMVEAFAQTLRERASDLDSIAIPGFGNFVAMKKPERITLDTTTGKRMLLPPNISVQFVAGSKLKRQVSNE